MSDVYAYPANEPVEEDEIDPYHKRGAVSQNEWTLSRAASEPQEA